MAARDLVKRHEADIVPVLAVFGAGIAEADEQQHLRFPYPRRQVLALGVFFRILAGLGLFGLAAAAAAWRGDAAHREVTVGDGRDHHPAR